MDIVGCGAFFLRLVCCLTDNSMEMILFRFQLSLRLNTVKARLSKNILIRLSAEHLPKLWAFFSDITILTYGEKICMPIGR